ncbi:hypothetical protein BWI02_RS08495 [Vibrio parahaemolyticus]|nr:hypothetical protein [Vibrio parahaemolyticus]
MKGHLLAFAFIFTLIGETPVTIKVDGHEARVKQCQYIAKNSSLNPYKVMTTYVPDFAACERSIKF